MSKFVELYEQAKGKAPKVTYVSPYTRGGLSDFPSVVLEMAGSQFLAKAIGGNTKNPKNPLLYRPDSIGVQFGNGFLVIESVKSLFERDALWCYRDPTSTNRSMHTYPVIERDAENPKEVTSAWIRLRKIIIPEVQKLFETDKSAVMKWNANHVPANQIDLPGERPEPKTVETPKATEKPKAATKPATKAEPKTAKAAVGDSVTDWLNSVIKGANVKLKSVGSAEFASAAYNSSDIISKNKLKAEIEHMGAKTTRASNSSTAVYELDGKVISFGYGGVTVKRK